MTNGKCEEVRCAWRPRSVGSRLCDFIIIVVDSPLSLFPWAELINVAKCKSKLHKHMNTTISILRAEWVIYKYNWQNHNNYILLVRLSICLMSIWRRWWGKFRCSVIQKEVLSGAHKLQIRLCPPRTQKQQAESAHKGGNDFKREDIWWCVAHCSVVMKKRKKNVPNSKLENQHLMIVGLLITPYPSKPQQSPNGFARTLAKLRHYFHNCNTILL